MDDVAGLPHLETSFSAVAGVLFDAASVADTLQKIVHLAERAVGGCEAAGIIAIDDSVISTIAASSDLVVRVDQLQIDTDEGPCVDAARHDDTFCADDLLDDDRWPAFGPAAVGIGIRSVLAYSLSTHRPSALNLYSGLPAAFGVIDRAQGLLFATLARYALDSAEERVAGETRERNLAEALRTRELIGQAQGILMERERITAEQAFAVLRRASQHMNVKLREVAETLVETGLRPDTGRDEE